jgi:hypothetical protein
LVTIVEDSQDPSPPQNVEISPGDSRIRFNWTASPSSDVVGYQVEYGFGGDPVTSVPLSHANFAAQGASPVRVGLGTDFTLTGAPNNTDIFVMIRAVDGAGHLSPVPTVADNGSAKVRPNRITPQWLSTYHPDSNGLVSATAITGDIMLIAERCSHDPTTEVIAGQITSAETCTANDGSLRIVSIADPRNPQQLARCSSDPGEACGQHDSNFLIRDARDVVTDGMYAYVAAGAQGVLVFDISDPSDPDDAGECGHNGTCLPTNGMAWAVAYQAGMIYVADGAGGFRTIDAHRPANLYGDRIRRCTGLRSGLCSLQPLVTGSPTYDADGLLANIPMSAAFEYDISSTDKRCKALDIEVNGAHVYFLKGSESRRHGENPCLNIVSGIQIAELMDDSTDSVADGDGDTSEFFPTASNTVNVITHSYNGFPKRFHLSGDLIFIPGKSAAIAGQPGLSIYHLPTILGGGSYQSALILYMPSSDYQNSVTVAGNYVVLGNSSDNSTGQYHDQNLKIYDLSTIPELIAQHAGNSSYATSIPLVGGWKAPAYSDFSVDHITARGSMLFVSYGRGTETAVITLDLQSPFSPQELNLSAPLDVSRASKVSLEVADRFLFVADDLPSSSSAQSPPPETVVKIYDLANIYAPTELGSISVEGPPIFDVDWPYVYVATDDGSSPNVQVYNVSDPSSPILITTLSIPNEARAIKVHGRYLLIGANPSASNPGFYTYNISNPSNPYVVKGASSSATTPTLIPLQIDGWVQQIDAHAGTVYAAASESSYTATGLASGGFEAIALTAANFSTATYSSSFASESSHPTVIRCASRLGGLCIDPNTPQQGRHRFRVWGGRLYGAIHHSPNPGSSDTPRFVVIGLPNINLDTLGDPVELMRSVSYMPPDFDTTYRATDVSGLGRYTYLTSRDMTYVIDARYSGTAPFTPSYEVVGSIAGPNDLLDGVDVGPYAVFAGSGSRIQIFDLEW